MPHATIRKSNGAASHRLYYERTGAGQPLLLIRGLGRSARFWAEVTQLFSRDFEVITFDNRGIGRSDAPWRPYTIRTLALDCVRLLDALGVERAHVFGMSLGGMIAQEVAIEHSERVLRLVLGCTTPGGRRGFRPPRQILREVARAQLASSEEKNIRVARVILSGDFVDENPALMTQWHQWLSDEPNRTRDLLKQILAVARHDTFERLSKIDLPTLVVYGDADRLIPPQNSPLIASRIPGSTLEVLPGIGHDFTTEIPEESVAVISAFLKT